MAALGDWLARQMAQAARLRALGSPSSTQFAPPGVSPLNASASTWGLRPDVSVSPTTVVGGQGPTAPAPVSFTPPAAPFASAAMPAANPAVSTWTAPVAPVTRPVAQRPFVPMSSAIGAGMAAAGRQNPYASVDLPLLVSQESGPMRIEIPVGSAQAAGLPPRQWSPQTVGNLQQAIATLLRNSGQGGSP